jgi:Ca2+-binding EF-hand superfamily protein
VETNLKSLFSIYASLNILSVHEKSEHLMEFYNLDKNRDGKIDYDELVEGMQNTFAIDREAAQESVGKIFAQSRKSHENFLEFHEYVTATTFVSK